MRPSLRQRGQSIVELTLTMPLLLVALYVPFDLGMSIYAGYLAQNVARDGARVASKTGSIDNATATALATQFAANLSPLLVSGSTTRRVTVNYYATGANCAQYVEVIAQGTYNFFWYNFVKMFGMSLPNSGIVRKTRMRYEYQPDANSAACSTTATNTGHS